MAQDPGKQLGSYGWNKFRFIGCIVCALIFIGVGIFSLTLMNIPTSREAAHGGIYFDTAGWSIPPTTLFFLSGCGLFLMGVFTILLAQNVKAKYTFTLFENGISSKYRGKENYLSFEDIEDVYLFSIGRSNYAGFLNSLAYRKNKHDEWIFISPLNSGSDKLISTFRQLHTNQRGEVLEEKMKQGTVLKFEYVSTKSVWLKRALSFRISDYLKIDSSLKDFYLTKDSITLDGKKVSIGPTDSINTDSWVENIYLIDNNGNKKFSLMYPSIISADVLRSLLERSVSVTEQ